MAWEPRESPRSEGERSERFLHLHGLEVVIPRLREVHRLADELVALLPQLDGVGTKGEPEIGGRAKRAIPPSSRARGRNPSPPRSPPSCGRARGTSSAARWRGNQGRARDRRESEASDSSIFTGSRS